MAKVFGALASASVLPMNIQDWFPFQTLLWRPLTQIFPVIQETLPGWSLITSFSQLWFPKNVPCTEGAFLRIVLSIWCMTPLHLNHREKKIRYLFPQNGKNGGCLLCCLFSSPFPVDNFIQPPTFKILKSRLSSGSMSHILWGMH